MTAKTTHTAVKIKSEVHNFKDSCRVCMSIQLEMSYIFAESCDILGKIEYCTGLKSTKDDGLPSYICKNCLQDLDTAYKFKSSCLLAYETYQNLQNIEIKTETEYLDSDGLIDDNELLGDDTAKIERVKVEKELNAEGNSQTKLSKTLKNSSIHPKRPYKKKLKSPEAIKQKKLPKSSEVMKRNNIQKLSSSSKIRKRIRYIRCSTCKIDFKTRSEKVEHMRSIHNLEPGTWICEHCGKVFKTKPSMEKHTLLHQPPKFACDQCDYKATYPADLKKHQLIHSGIKRVQCQICAARFRTTSNLWYHIRKEHEKGEPKLTLTCEFCRKDFHDRSEYRMHLDTHTNERRFVCNICGSAFKRRTHWRRHRLTLHNELVPKIRPGRKKAYEAEGNSEIEEKCPIAVS